MSARAKHYRRASSLPGFTALTALADLQCVHAHLPVARARGARGRLEHIVGYIASIAKVAQGVAAAVHALALHHHYVNLLRGLK